MSGRGTRTFPNLISETVRGCAAFLTRWIPSPFRFELTKFDVETLRNEIRELLGEDGVLLCPAHPTRVPYHGESLFKPFNFLYSAIFNVIGTPVTTVPVGLDQDGLPIGIQVHFIYLFSVHTIIEQ